MLSSASSHVQYSAKLTAAVNESIYFIMCHGAKAFKKWFHFWPLVEKTARLTQPSVWEWFKMYVQFMFVDFLN